MAYGKVTIINKNLTDKDKEKNRADLIALWRLHNPPKNNYIPKKKKKVTVIPMAFPVKKSRKVKS